MQTAPYRLFLASLIALATLVPQCLFAQGTADDYQRANELRKLTANKIFPRAIEPHWAADGSHLWYLRRMQAAKEFIRVDLPAGERQPAFDHAQLAKQLSAATNKAFSAERLPFESIEIVPGGSVRFTAAGSDWEFAPATGKLAARKEAKEADDANASGSDGATPQNNRQGGSGRVPGRGDIRDGRADSPDGQWRVFVRDFNLFLRNRESGEESRLSENGTADDGYGQGFFWSPDSSRLVALKTKQVEERRVYIVESSPKDQLQPKLHDYVYIKPGDRIDVTTPHLFDIAAREEIAVDDALLQNPWNIGEFHWSPDSQQFQLLFNQRGHQTLRVLAIDAKTGEMRTLIEETSPTFIDYSQKTDLRYLDDSQEILWMSERDGWNHLYLFDATTGKLKNQITRGPWVVRGIDRVDAERRQIWFRAMGIHPAQDPYYEHFCRIDFDGQNLVRLTEGDGTHKIDLSPDDQFLIDTYSRVDLPPVTQLRRATDGSLVCELEKCDLAPLAKIGWQTPERFVAKGRDGQTDIYGIILRPTNFDPAKKYPVIEKIYAGPHGFFVPKEFRPYHSAQSLAELGFIVVQIDGMGTNWRSRAFHDVCWKNLKDAGFPDRILWLQAAAKKVPQMDLTRVGIYGGSAGGQSTLAGLLHHGDFYKVGVADCGCHDNRIDKMWWAEAWMGWPVDASYADNSNVTHAHRLQGKLLLTVAELDRNVDPATTMQVVNALIQADKDFDLLVVPGAGHGVGETPYAKRRRQDFFVRNLLGVEPRHSAAETKATTAAGE